MELTLNTIKDTTYSIIAITQDLAKLLRSYGEETTDKKKVDELLKEMNLLPTEIMYVVGDGVNPPTVSNHAVEDIIPFKEVSKLHKSWCCYAGNDYTKATSSKIIHEDAASSFNCAISLMGNPKYIIIVARKKKDSTTKELLDKGKTLLNNGKDRDRKMATEKEPIR